MTKAEYESALEVHERMLDEATRKIAELEQNERRAKELVEELSAANFRLDERKRMMDQIYRQNDFLEGQVRRFRDRLKAKESELEDLKAVYDADTDQHANDACNLAFFYGNQIETVCQQWGLEVVRRQNAEAEVKRLKLGPVSQ